MRLLLLILLAALLFAAHKFVFALRNLGAWNQAYARLAWRYAGKKSTGGVVQGSVFANPKLHFKYGQTHAVLTNRRSKRFAEGLQTKLILGWPDHKILLEIVTGDAIPLIRTFRRVQPFEPTETVGWDKFTMLSNQPNDVQKWCTSSVSWLLEQLMEVGESRSLSVSIARGQIEIAKPGYLKDFQLLDDFVRLGLELYDQLRLGQVSGISFLHADQAAILEAVKCPICSEIISQTMVVCQRCKTPHCLDCWQYNGQCATFACRETKFINVGKVNAPTLS